MSQRVRILPPEIISKIAAGEVIERPASVVKELLENAIDAEASTIEIHIKNAGKELIRVLDNGLGVGREDIETIFIRHATSKIQALDDLWAIQSLGFRGEALYSVAAIADVVFRSRLQEQETGWEIHLRGGQKQSLRPVGCPVGTEIQVKELFYNTPARKKFLKTNTTETQHILNTVIPYTLLHPNLRFLLTHNTKPLLDTLPHQDLRQRVAAILHLDSQYILEVQEGRPNASTAVHLLLGDINLARPRRDQQFIFINGRPVQNKAVAFHINNVYRLILPPNRYPFFILCLTYPARDIDLNIHPTKREVKLKNETTLCSWIRHLCEQTLLSAGTIKQAAVIPSPSSESPSPRAPTYVPEKLFHEPLDQELFEPTLPYNKPTPTEQYAFPQTPYSLAGDTVLQQHKKTLRNKLQQARYIGAFMRKFLLFEHAQSLLLMDQHAAAERVTFEQLIRQMNKGHIETQHLLSPDLVSLSPQERIAWETNQPTLEQAGFVTTLFDETTVAIHAYPSLIKDPRRALQGILAGDQPARVDHETLARRACRSSIMTGDALQPREADQLRRQLLHCQDPFTCPHGRPTLVEMTEEFLDKQFLRT